MFPSLRICVYVIPARRPTHRPAARCRPANRRRLGYWSLRNSGFPAESLVDESLQHAWIASFEPTQLFGRIDRKTDHAIVIPPQGGVHAVAAFHNGQLGRFDGVRDGEIACMAIPWPVLRGLSGGERFQHFRFEPFTVHVAAGSAKRSGVRYSGRRKKIVHVQHVAAENAC